MIEWSEQHLMIRDVVRRFVEAEIVPHVEELEHGDMPPYDILRKLLLDLRHRRDGARALPEADRAREGGGDGARRAAATSGARARRRRRRRACR